MVSSIGMRPRKVGFSVDSPLEGDGFEPSVPREDEPRKARWILSHRRIAKPRTTTDPRRGRRIRTPRLPATGSSVFRGRGAPERTPRFSPAF